jgi:hypothetical protein
MGRPTLAALQAMGAFSTLFRWELIITAFPSAVTGFNSDDFNLRAETAEVPKKTGDVVEIWIRGLRVIRPGIYKPSGTITLNFIEGVDHLLHKYINAWRQVLWEDGTGLQRSVQEVSMDFLLHLLDDQDNPVYEYAIFGSILTEGDPGGTPDQQTADPMKPSLILAYQDFTEQFLG